MDNSSPWSKAIGIVLTGFLLLFIFFAISGGSRQQPDESGPNEKTHTDQAPGSTAASSTALQANSPPAKVAPDIPDMATSQVAAKQNLQSILKDPDSAEYQNVVAIKEEQMYIFCGQINSKNSFGAYTGYERFIATPIQSFLSDAPDFDTGWQNECIDHTGTPVDF